ncbi:hypothetical protein KL935_003791 [Ogataea polymorpha]|uniref:Uncharacterized protein n=1 Tax=Ogataea polymorpha TaxID=460523 RepID=A0A1B7SB62_9ASCO|nr:uncharacterized protein OGAPODRAFT_103282 [Ogataea polymorpha]KAG7899481.1 hypothetical protein KL935_003791 [Ogataea polymorpha]KAG7904696.1 hypothetical protein KL907_003572 [Ogataea polymorpha]KAG7932974.1 hypothetical protein KL934_003629 [Ogataea polymorpha]KAH3659629.1 hypothetical protein OGATHE_005674 [Ogataea polymorpha]OBA13727.1 hypothetical protein OGAPODRAFT_103282 [Ogataea polymorpha]
MRFGVVFVITQVLADFTYLGCYSSDAISGLTKKDSYTWQSSSHCTEQCSGHAVAALINGQDCYCGDDVPSDNPDGSCTTSCTGYPMEKCGGSDSYSVYVDESEENDDDSSSAQSSHSSTDDATSTSSTSTTSSSSSSLSSSSTSSSSTQSSSPQSSTMSSTDSSPTSSSLSASSTTTSSISSFSVSQSSSSSSTTSSSTPSSESVRITTSVSPGNMQTSIIYITQSVATATSASAAASSSSASSANNRSTGLSKGAKAGIAVGSILGALLLLGLLLLFLFWRRRQRDDRDNLSEKRASSILASSPRQPPAGSRGAAAGIGANAFGFMSEDDRLDMPGTSRRFSDGSLPDAAAGAAVPPNSARQGGLRVVNPDLSDEE